MKKKVILILAALVVTTLLFRWSGILRAYKIPSSSSEPTLKVGSRIIGSSLKKPKHHDFAYFKFSDSLDGWTIVKRLIAIPNDTLECKNGNFIINGKNSDKTIDLRFSYKILPDVFDKYIKDEIDETEFYRYYKSDSVIAFLDDSFVDKLPIHLDRNFDNRKSLLSKEIFSDNSNWTVSNFGPLVLPEGKYFFSGDNRDNSIDSRYRGYVDKKYILGTVLINL